MTGSEEIVQFNGSNSFSSDLVFLFIPLTIKLPFKLFAAIRIEYYARK